MKVCCGCALPYEQCCGAKGNVDLTDSDFRPMPHCVDVEPGIQRIYKDRTEPYKPAGYLDLTDLEQELLGEINELGIKMSRLVETITTFSGNQKDGEGYRWVAIARAHLQQGKMALTRAVTRPDNF